MLQNTSKTLGFQKIMVYKTPSGGGGKPYLARGLYPANAHGLIFVKNGILVKNENFQIM